MFCKQLLGVQKQTTNLGVLLELGRIPLQNFVTKAAIKNCGSGPKDIDCDIKDYIATEDDFNQVVERGSAYQAELNYDDLRRNDVVERSGF